MEIIWNPIPGWEGYYEVSNVGLIKSVERTYFNGIAHILTTTGILKPKLDKDCYLQVTLCKQGQKHYYKVNQLVAKTFLPNPANKPFTDHINGVRWDNRVENLRWVTQSENIKAAFELGRKKVASKEINQYDLAGNFIKHFDAISHVEKDGYKSRTVNDALIRRNGNAYGYKWEYVKINNTK